MRFAAMILLALSVVGCFGGGEPAPRDRYYRISVSPPDPAAEPVGVLSAGVLSVMPLDSDGLLRERPVLYSLSGQDHQVEQHDYHYWSDPPTRMLQGEIARYLKQSGLARAVVTPEMRLRPDFEVIGRIKRLERLLGDGPPRVVAELELTVIETGKDRMVISQNYRAEVTSQNSSVAAAVLAINEALEKIFSAFVADIRRS